MIKTQKFGRVFDRMKRLVRLKIYQRQLERWNRKYFGWIVASRDVPNPKRAEILAEFTKKPLSFVHDALCSESNASAQLPSEAKVN